MSSAEDFLFQAKMVDGTFGYTVTYKEALEAVRLAREEAVKDHLRIGSKELDLLIEAHKETNEETEARVRLQSMQEFEEFLAEPDSSLVIPMNLGKKPVKIFMGEQSSFKKFKKHFLLGVGGEKK